MTQDEKNKLVNSKILLNGLPATIISSNTEECKIVTFDGSYSSEWPWFVAKRIIERENGKFFYKGEPQ